MLSARRLDPYLFALTAVAVGVACVQLAYRTEPFVPLITAVAVVVLALAVSRPLITLYASIALIPLELVSLELGQAGVSPAEALFVATGVGWAVRRLVAGELPFVASPLTKPLLLLVLAIVPGLAITDDTFLVMKILVMWTGFFLVYQLVVAEASPADVRWILLTLAFSGAVVGVIATIKSGAGAEQSLIGVGEEARNRAEGSFGHPNTLATFQALALPAALALGLEGSRRLRPAAFAAFALISVGLALSLSRGGLLAVAGALLVMALWRPFRRVVAVTALVALAFVVAGANPLGDVQQVETVTQRLSSVGYSAQGVDPRFAIWRETPTMIADHPLFGVSAGGFPEVAPRYGLLGPRSESFEHAHNIALTIAAELGLIGLGALIWAFVALVRELLRAYSRADDERRGLTLAIAAGLTALAVQGMVDYTLRVNAVVAIVFTLAACAVVLAERGGQHGRAGGRYGAPSPDTAR